MNIYKCKGKRSSQVKRQADVAPSETQTDAFSEGIMNFEDDTFSSRSESSTGSEIQSLQDISLAPAVEPEPLPPVNDQSESQFTFSGARRLWNRITGSSPFASLVTSTVDSESQGDKKKCRSLSNPFYILSGNRCAASKEQQSEPQPYKSSPANSTGFDVDDSLGNSTPNTIQEDISSNRQARSRKKKSAMCNINSNFLRSCETGRSGRQSAGDNVGAAKDVIVTRSVSKNLTKLEDAGPSGTSPQYFDTEGGWEVVDTQSKKCSERQPVFSFNRLRAKYFSGENIDLMHPPPCLCDENCTGKLTTRYKKDARTWLWKSKKQQFDILFMVRGGRWN